MPLVRVFKQSKIDHSIADEEGRSYGEDWPIVQLGEDDEYNYWLTTDRMPVTEVPIKLIEPSERAAFIARRINEWWEALGES